MIRPFRSEVERYGDYSKPGEYIYDHPFQWGSRRTGPDLAREGVKGGKQYRPNSWHYEHLVNPQKTNIQSIMPPYPWLTRKVVNTDLTPTKIRAMVTLGVPYEEGYDAIAVEKYFEQAKVIGDDLRSADIDVKDNTEIIALIAYLQRLGTDLSGNNDADKYLSIK